MIGFFPDPYPNELLYSACARYFRKTDYLNKKSVMTELFGKRGFSAIVDFPTRLNHLISVLPQGHKYSTKQIINKNTFFPYYQPFIPIKKAELVRNEMEKGDINRIHARLGTRIKQIENPKYLRFCPTCVFADRQKYGETYWHRIHQLAGILVCPSHQCFLENSSVQLGRMSSSFFHDAETFLPSNISKENKLNFQNPSHKIFYKTACDAQWLLLSPNLQIGSEIIRDRYFNILLKKGYAYYNGRLKHTKLLQASQNFFPPEVFEIIGRVSKRENWIIILTQVSNVDTTYHPIRHLLLLTFLGMSTKEFFTEFVEFKPFGNPPYPCLNYASNHYRELVIQECQIFDNISKEINKQGIPLGVFRCDCGFTYQRLGPDKSEDDKYSFSSVREYGEVWESKFKELWADLSISGGEIGRQTGINQTSVGRQAIRLSLPMNTKDTRSLQGYKRHRNPNKSFTEIREQYRNRWLKVKSDHPYLTRKQLLDQENFLYLWLKRNDAEWFENHLPQQASKQMKQERLDWKQIDLTLSKKVEGICKNISDSDEFPIRICISEIIKRIGHKVWLDKRHEKLPLISQVIDENIETLEAFMLRKIKWTTKYFIQEGIIPSNNQFQIKAVVRNQTSFDSPKIQKAIKDALCDIENSLDPSI